MWTRPSISSCNCTNAPKLASLVTLPVDEVADLVFLSMFFHGIVGKLLNPEADPLIRLIDIDHFRLDFVVLLEDLASDD